MLIAQANGTTQIHKTRTAVSNSFFSGKDLPIDDAYKYIKKAHNTTAKTTNKAIRTFLCTFGFILISLPFIFIIEIVQ
jgi:hypothetical protein